MTRSLNEGFTVCQLRLYQQQHILSSLFIDPDNPDDFVAGYVEALSARHVVLRSVSPFGRYDGFILVRVADVTLAIGEDDYAERLRRLLHYRGEQPTLPFSMQADEDLLHAICRNAQEGGRVLTLWTADGEYVGRVERLDDMRVTLASLDFFGENPISETLALRDVEQASFGAEDDCLYEVLSRGSARLCGQPEET